jgi:drug/metabolite transporter (DMT)-like permease
MSLAAASPRPAAPRPAARLRDFLLMVFGATLIGNSSVLVRLSEMEPAAIAFWRVAFAIPVLALWAAALERESLKAGGLTDRRMLIPAALAGLAFAADLILANVALAWTSIANFIVLVHLAPIFVVIVAWAWLKERPSGLFMAALALALIGAAILVQTGSRGGTVAGQAGDLLSIVVALCYAGFILGLRFARPFGGAGVVSLVSSIVCAIACLITALVLGETIMPQTPRQWLTLAALGVLCHAIGQGLSAHAVTTLGASVTSVVLVYGVLVTVIGGWLVFHETLTPWQTLGGALVIAAVVLVRPR